MTLSNMKNKFLFPLIVFCLLFTFSFSGKESISEKYIKAQDMLRNRNYNEAVKAFIVVHKEEKHANVAFFISYSYKKLNKVSSSKKYFQIAYENEDELRGDFKIELEKIRQWLDSPLQNGILRTEVSLNGRWSSGNRRRLQSGENLNDSLSRSESIIQLKDTIITKYPYDSLFVD